MRVTETCIVSYLIIIRSANQESVETLIFNFATSLVTIDEWQNTTEIIEFPHRGLQEALVVL